MKPNRLYKVGDFIILDSNALHVMAGCTFKVVKNENSFMTLELKSKWPERLSRMDNKFRGQYLIWSNPHRLFEYAIDYVVKEVLDEET